MTVLYRSADWDTPWSVRPDRVAGRYHRAESEPTQYLCEHPLTMLAERLRSLGSAAVTDLLTCRWRCWAMDVPTDDLIVVDFDSATTYGITPEDLVSDDWASCQDLAERRRTAGDRGLIVPSAALPGTRNVVLFGPRISSPYLAVPIDPSIESPTAHSAQHSVPPSEVVDFVRWHTKNHDGLEAWRRSEPFTFVDPLPTNV